MKRGKTAAETCRLNGFVVGDHLVGDEGYGPSVIRITAIGEQCILAVEVSHNGERATRDWERTWTLDFREWSKTSSDAACQKDGE